VVAKSFQRRNKVVGLTSKEVFGPGCLLTCEGFPVIDVLLPGVGDQVIQNADMHIMLKDRHR